jgi:hypothetical protein
MTAAKQGCDQPTEARNLAAKTTAQFERATQFLRSLLDDASVAASVAAALARPNVSRNQPQPSGVGRLKRVIRVRIAYVVEITPTATM